MILNDDYVTMNNQIQSLLYPVKRPYLSIMIDENNDTFREVN